MARKSYVVRNQQLNDIINLTIEDLASAPVTTDKGHLYYNTVSDRPFVNVGTSGTPDWKRILLDGDVTGSTGEEVTRTVVAGAADELMVSGGADRTATSYTTDGLVKIASGVVAQAIAWTDYVTGDSTNTFTNKTFDANGTGNSLSNVDYADFAAGVVDEDISTVSASHDTLASALAIKTYVDGLLAANDAMVYKGVIDCSTNPNYPAGDAGDTYKVSVAGKIGGASGINVEVGDMIICTVDATATGDHATVGANWNIIQVNIDGAVTGPTSSTDNSVARFDGTSGKVIQGSSVVIDDSNNVSGIVNLTVTGTTTLATHLTGALYATAWVVDVVSNVTRRFDGDFVVGDWAWAGPYTITIASATLSAAGISGGKYVIVQVYEDGTPNSQVDVEVTVADSGDVVITSEATFGGHYVIVG